MGPTAAEELLFGDGPADGPELVEQVLTAYGRIEGSLRRILLLLSNVPFASRVLNRGASVHGVITVLSRWAIRNYYSRAGLEDIGPTVPSGLTRLAFCVEHGLLGGLVAGGPHFHRGVPREVSAMAVFTPMRSFLPLVPTTQL